MIGILILTTIAFIFSIILVLVDSKKAKNYCEYLPGLNCGGCGYGSCEGMSEAIKEDFENYKKCRILKGDKLEKFLKECKKDV